MVTAVRVPILAGLSALQASTFVGFGVAYQTTSMEFKQWSAVLPKSLLAPV